MFSIVFSCRLFFRAISSIFLSSWRFFLGDFTTHIFFINFCFSLRLFLLSISSMVFLCWMLFISECFVFKVKSRICSLWSSTDCESFSTDFKSFWLFSKLSWNFCCNSVILLWQTDSSVSVAHSKENFISKWSSTPTSIWSMRWTLLSYEQTTKQDDQRLITSWEGL